MNEWVSVKDGLPERVVDNSRSSDSSRHVLAHFMRVGTPCIGVAYYHYHRQEWRVIGFDVGTEVTHWQPLPEPPVEPEKRVVGCCKDCRHWKERRDYGTCVLLSDSSRGDELTLSDGPVGTRFDFGCISFRARGEG